MPPATPPASRCASWDDGAVAFPGGQLQRLNGLRPVTARAPGLLTLYGIGPNTAALLLIAAGTIPAAAQRGCLAHLCALLYPCVASGTTRHRLNPAATARPTMRCGGSCSPTARRGHPRLRRTRTKEGKSKAEIIRCLKRYVTRQLPPPAPGRRLPTYSGRPDPIFAAANLLAFERSACVRPQL